MAVMRIRDSAMKIPDRKLHVFVTMVVLDKRARIFKFQPISIKRSNGANHVDEGLLVKIWDKRVIKKGLIAIIESVVKSYMFCIRRLQNF